MAKPSPFLPSLLFLVCLEKKPQARNDAGKRPLLRQGFFFSRSRSVDYKGVEAILFHLHDLLPLDLEERGCDVLHGVACSPPNGSLIR